MRIVIVRHGETMSNIINGRGIDLYTGALNNELTDLTKKGENQAKELSENDIIKSIEKVYSSDLNRAVQTARLAKPGFEININKDLRERCLGEFEGKEKKDLIKLKQYEKYFNNKEFNNFRTDFMQKAPNGENYTQVSMRCKRFLDSLEFNEKITIGIFSHLHAIRCLFLNILKIEPKEEVFNLKIENCESYVFDGDSLEEMKLVSHDLSDLIRK